MFFCLFLLTKYRKTIIIISGLSGETGANPVRARRRQVYRKAAGLTKRHNWETAIGLLGSKI